MNGPVRQTDEGGASAARFGAHRHLATDLKAWLDGELSAPRVWLVQAHLLICPACREEVTWLKRLGEDMRDLEQAVPSPRLRARILAALPDTPPGRPVSEARPRRVARRLAPAPAFAAIGAVAFAAAAMSVWSVAHRPSAGQAPGSVVHAERAMHPRATVQNPGPQEAVVAVQPADPHSLEADRLLAQFLRDEAERHSVRLAANRKNWKHIVALINAPQAAGRAQTDPVRLDIAVPDVADAEARLTAWAAAGGGSAVTGTGRQPALPTMAPMIDPTERATGPTRDTDAAGATVVTVRMASAKLARLEAVLADAGAWPAGRSAGAVGAIATAGPVRRPDGPPARPSQAVAQPRGAVPTSIAAAGSSAPDQVMARDSGGSMVTLQIHLSSLDEPMR